MVEVVNSVNYEQKRNPLSYVTDGVAGVFHGVGDLANSLSGSFYRAGATLSSIPSPTVFGYGWGWGPYYCGVPGIGVYGYPMYFGTLSDIAMMSRGFDSSAVTTAGASTTSPSTAQTGGCACGCGGTQISAAQGGAQDAASGAGVNASFNANDSSWVNVYNPDSPHAYANMAFSYTPQGGYEQLSFAGSSTGMSVPQETSSSLGGSAVNNYVTLSSALSTVDRALNPANYNADGTPKTTSGGLDTNDAKNRPIDLVDAKTGKISTPAWYRAIANKVEQKQKLTPEEQRLYQHYNEIRRKYSPYLLDENLNIKTDANGQKMESSFYQEMLQLNQMVQRKSTSQIEAYIKSCSKEKLAALELWFPTVLASVNGGKSLREVIKEASLTGWFWIDKTNWNTDACKRIFDKLDEAAMETPTNMHFALSQALEGHHLWGLGYDETRLYNLLKKMETNKVFRDYVKQEYPELITDIDKKWWKSDRVTELFNKIFS